MLFKEENNNHSWLGVVIIHPENTHYVLLMPLSVY